MLHVAFPFLLALAIRLLAWRWREFYPLGGDEQEYFNQAVVLLRDWQYTELRFMRPPAYPVFLAVSIYFVDSLVQNLRLVQAIVSAATVPLVYLLTREVVLLRQQSAVSSQNAPRLTARAPLIAALLCALSYSLAVNATELLTEALFLFGLTLALWLLLRAGRTGGRLETAAAGLVLGALCLVRSVALPLVPLGALWLLVNAKGKRQKAKGKRQKAKTPLVAAVQPVAPPRHTISAWLRPALVQFCLFTFSFCLVLLPWTARNYVTYGGVILIDTTGAENLWLDNDPAGREAVKAQLYAMGDDRLGRQRLAAQRGAEVILADPARFLAKMWGELTKFFALEFSDDMRSRPAIWVPPAEVWMRLILGDGLWLLLIVMGGYGLFGKAKAERRKLKPRAPRPTPQGRLRQAQPAAMWPEPVEGHAPNPTPHARVQTQDVAPLPHFTILDRLRDPAWLFGLWGLYVLLTTLVFHVELRYRLPLYPVLLVYAAIVLAGVPWSSVVGRRSSPPGTGGRPITRCLWPSLLPSAFCLLTFLHAPYPAMAWQLGWKHWHLSQAEATLARGDAAAAEAAAAAALARDDRSALARVALARAALLRDDRGAALRWLDAAIAAVPAHPHAHLLRGDLLRAGGDLEGARAGLAFEPNSLEDLQGWAARTFTTPPAGRLALGDGLDLGFVHGFHSVRPGEEGYRWTAGAAEVRLADPGGAATLRLRLDSGRPAGATVLVQVLLAGRTLGTLNVAAGWADYRLPLPADRPAGDLTITLRSPTFTPRQFDRASADGRHLGVRVQEVRSEK